MRKIENGLEYTEEILLDTSEGYMKRYPSKWKKFKNWIKGKRIIY